MLLTVSSEDGPKVRLINAQTQIYRCSQGNQAAWDRLLQALRSEVQDSLRYYIRPDLLEFHDLHVIDDKSL